MELIKLLIVAATLEAVWETIKMFWEKGKINIDRIGAALLGILLCLSTKVDFFALVDVQLTWPIVGMVLSGLLISRGANFIHDFLDTVSGLRG